MTQDYLDDAVGMLHDVCLYPVAEAFREWEGIVLCNISSIPIAGLPMVPGPAEDRGMGMPIGMPLLWGIALPPALIPFMPGGNGSLSRATKL